jgi:hypothetical protein
MAKNARPREESLESEAILPNFHEWTVRCWHGSILWLTHYFTRRYFSVRNVHLCQCKQQMRGVLVKGESFLAGAGTCCTGYDIKIMCLDCTFPIMSWTWQFYSSVGVVT